MSENLSNEEASRFWDERWKSGERYWDHGRAAPPFVEFVERKEAPAGKVLIPGCGSGHDVGFFASLGAQVTGLDVSARALEIASEENPHPNAEYRLGDFFKPDQEMLGSFDWVIEHTCLCALPPHLWVDYAQSLRSVLKPGGSYLAIFYRNPSSEEGPPFGIDEATIDSLFADSFSLLEAWVPTKSYASRASREELRWYRMDKAVQ